ncbi:MAG: 5'-3' exonuclease H3TH domain-containing protein [Dehalococcoidia bacterium]|nr:5'-3' exonuclease H3TH domain-containing protein [Dehalococcoidia bacterium]
MDVHLLDGTYELFRHFFGVPSQRDTLGREVGAVRGVLASVLGMFEGGTTHLGVATDHIVESFRNELWPDYKTGEGIDPDLWTQFGLLEEALTAMGVVIWPMEQLEADDALASAAASAAADPAVERVYICSPDKDLSQCVVGDRIVQLDRRANTVRDAAGVVEKFGVPPQSIPDYLALVGDSADGFPGVSGWGAKSAAAVLAHYGHVEAIPDDEQQWEVTIRGRARLAAALADQRELAMLFLDLATLRTDPALFDHVGELRWPGPLPSFDTVCERMGATTLPQRARAVAARVA